MAPDLIGRRVRGALDIVGLLHKERAMPLTLSGGEQQRVGVARAVVSRPQLLLADEPTANLDPDLSVEIMKLFRRLNEVGVSMLIASHAFDLIRRMGKRIIHLEDGKVVSITSPASSL
jgi:cell division transport system ATP-binding protein